MALSRVEHAAQSISFCFGFLRRRQLQQGPMQMHQTWSSIGGKLLLKDLF